MCGRGREDTEKERSERSARAGRQTTGREGQTCSVDGQIERGQRGHADRGDNTAKSLLCLTTPFPVN